MAVYLVIPDSVLKASKLRIRTYLGFLYGTVCTRNSTSFRSYIANSTSSPNHGDALDVDGTGETVTSYNIQNVVWIYVA